MMTGAVMVGLKGMVALTAAGGLAALLQHAPASRRHMVWAGGLGALLLLPVLQWGGPKWDVRVPGSQAVARAVATAPSTRRSPTASVTVGGSRAMDAALRGTAALGSARQGEGGPRTTLPASPTEGDPAAPRTRDVRTPGDTDGSVGAAGTPPSAPATGAQRGSLASEMPAGSLATGAPAGSLMTRTLSRAVASVLGWLWLIGIALLSIRLVRSYRAASVLARSGTMARRAVQARATELSRHLGAGATATVRIHPSVAVPLVVGLRRPVILLPRDAEKWSQATLDHVLLHELAHVARRDPWLHAMADAARALHWPNPLAWAAVRRLRLESERACDDRVLEAGRAPSRYAEDLLRVARALGAAPAPPRAAAAMARTPDLARRLDAILDVDRARQPAGRRALAATGVVMLIAAIGLGGATPAPPSAAADTETTESGSVVVDVRVPGVAEVPETAPRRVADPVASLREPLARSLSESGPSPYAEPSVPTGPAGLPGTTVRRQESALLCGFVDRDGGRSTRIHIDDDRFEIQIEQRDCRVEVEARGDIRFSDDDRSIVALGDDAYFEIEERDRTRERRVRIRPDDAGGVERRWWVDGERREWGADADAWLATVLPVLFQETTFNARARVQRMLDEGGVDRVLDATETMHSGAVARRYVELAVELGRVSEAQAIRIMGIAGRMEGDHHKASLLSAMARAHGLGTRRLQEPFLEAALSIGADHHVRNVLEVLLDQPGLTDPQWDAVVRAAGRIEADHHTAALLKGVVASGGPGVSGRASFLEALRSIDADHHQRNVLEAFLDQGRVSPEEISQILSLSGEIGADHHRASILQQIADRYSLDGEPLDAFVRTARGIEADHHLRSVVERLLGRDELSPAQVDAVLDMVERVGADHHRLALLEPLAQRHALTGAQRERYVWLAEQMSRRRSDQALAVLARTSG